MSSSSSSHPIRAESPQRSAMLSSSQQNPIGAASSSSAEPPAPMYRISGVLRQAQLVNGKLDIAGIEASLQYEVGTLRILCIDRAGREGKFVAFARTSTGLSFYSWREMTDYYYFSDDNILLLSGKPNMFIVTRFLIGSKVQFYMNYDRRILHSSVTNLGWKGAKLVTYEGDHDLELNEGVSLPLQNGRRYYLIRADEWFLELLKVVLGSLGTFTGINNIGRTTRRIAMEEVVTIFIGIWAVTELVKGGAVPFYVSRWIWWGMKRLWRKV